MSDYESRGILKGISMLATLRASAITFKKDTPEKLAFIVLNILDMALTTFAMNVGASELNPFMRSAFGVPYLTYFVKLAFPVFLAWLLPGKLLIPSIFLLIFIIVWNSTQLVLFFF
jgi:hypothetical protein